MAGVESDLNLPLIAHGQGTATTGSSSRVYSNINISGDARVHLGDAYFDNLTINQLCLVHQANEAIVHQIGTLRSLAGNSACSPINDSVQGQVEETNGGIRLTNTQLRKAMNSAENPAPKKKFVSQTRLSFTLIPLAFSFERNVYEEEAAVVAWQSLPKPQARRAIPPTTTVASLWIPKWFAGYQYGICIQRSRSGWLFCPRILRESRYETFYMKACSYGWLDKVQSQLVKNPNAVHDRHKGFTGADLALRQGEFEVVSLLAEQGVQVTINLEDLVRKDSDMDSTRFFISIAGFLKLICPPNPDTTSAGSALGSFELWVGTISQHIDLLRRIFDMEECEFWDLVLHKSPTPNSSRELDWLRMLLKYPRWSYEEAVLSLMSLSDLWLSVYEDGRYVIHLAACIMAEYERAIPPWAFRLEYEFDGKRFTILHWLFKNVGWLIGVNQPINKVWLRYIGHAVGAGVSIHKKSLSSDGSSMTPFWMICWRQVGFRHRENGECLFDLRANIDNFLQSLASGLLEAGIDLSAYGKMETELMDSLSSPHRTSPKSDAEAMRWATDVQSFTYGSALADWKFQYKTDYCDCFPTLKRYARVGRQGICCLIAAMVQFQAQRDNLRINRPLEDFDVLPFWRVTDCIQDVLDLRDGLQRAYDTLSMPDSCTSDTTTSIHAFCKVYGFLAECSSGDNARYLELIDHVFGSLHNKSGPRIDAWWASGTVVLCKARCAKCRAISNGKAWRERSGMLLPT